MAKRSAVEALEKAIRDAIANCRELKGMSERTHFETVDEAIDLIREGVTMRIEELNNEDDEE